MAAPKIQIHNSDPLGRKHDNVPPEYFGKSATRGRGLSLSGLRPSFFAMLKREAERKSKGK